MQFTHDIRADSRRLRIALILIACIPPLAAFTNPYHHLVRESTHIEAGEPFDELVYGYPPFLWIIFAYVYLIAFYAMLLLIRQFNRGMISRSRIMVILLGSSFPILGGMLTLADISILRQRDMTPLMYSLGSIFIAWGLFRSKLFSLQPIVHRTILATMRDAVIAVDLQNSIIELNPAARHLFKLENTLTDQLAGTVFAAWPEITQCLEQSAASDSELEIDDRCFQLHVLPLHNRRGRLIGHLITLHDITTLKTSERALAQNRNELNRLVLERTAELVATNQSLVQSEQRYRDLLERAPVPIFIYQDGRFVYTNAAAITLHDATQADDLIGKALVDFVHPDDKEHFMTLTRDAANHRDQVRRSETRIVRQDGTVVYLEATSMSIDFEGHCADMVIALDVTEQARSQVALHEYAARLETLRDIDQAILQAHTPAAIAEAALDRLQHLIPYHYASVILFTADHQGIDTLYTTASNAPPPPPGFDIPLPQWTSYEELIKGQVRYVADTSTLEQPSPAEEWLIKANIQSYILFPLMVHGTLIGALNIFNMRSKAFAPNTIEIARELANQIAIAIKQAYLYEQTQQQATQLQVYHDIDRGILTAQSLEEIAHATLRHIHELVPCTRAGVSIFDMDTREAVTLATLANGTAIFGAGTRLPLLDLWLAALSTGAPFMLEDTSAFPDPPPELRAFNAAGVLTLLLVPLRVQDDLIGSLNLMADIPQAFTSEHVTIAQEIADQVAIAIRQARLHDQIQQQAARLRVFYDIGRGILTAQSPEEIANAALGHIRQLVPCDQAGVSIFDLDQRESTILAMLSEDEPVFKAGFRAPLYDHWLNALSAGDPLLLTDADALPDPSPEVATARAAGIRSLLTIPLHTQDALIGALNLMAYSANTFTADHIAIAQEIATSLAIALNQTRLHRQVQQYADELEQRVEARTTQLMAANERLEALSVIQDEFVSNVSHELRTPISNLKLHLELMGLRPEKRERYLSTLQHETARLENLIEGLLTLSRLDQGRVTIRRMPINLNELCAQYVSDRVPLAEINQLELHFDPDPDLPRVKADANLIGQVLSILMTNALQYTPSQGSITITTGTTHFDDTQWVGFSIQDTGPGIADHEQERLFTRFFRGEVGRESGAAGTGLGLSIAKKIVTEHNGRITAHSTGIPGEGTTFTVWLPM